MDLIGGGALARVCLYGCLLLPVSKRGREGPHPLGMHGGWAPGAVQAPGMHPTRTGRPARASDAVRVQEQPPRAHQHELLQQQRRLQHLLGA